VSPDDNLARNWGVLIAWCAVFRVAHAFVFYRYTTSMKVPTLVDVTGPAAAAAVTAAAATVIVVDASSGAAAATTTTAAAATSAHELAVPVADDAVTAINRRASAIAAIKHAELLATADKMSANGR
jgi:hypothetical protein